MASLGGDHSPAAPAIPRHVYLLGVWLYRDELDTSTVFFFASAYIALKRHTFKNPFIFIKASVPGL